MAILQLPYNLSALFNFNEPDTNEGAMESSDEDFFDLFDFLPENTVTTNYLAKGEDRIQSLLRIKPRRTYSMNDFFKLFSRDQFWKKSNSRKDFTEYLIKTYWKKVIDPFVNTLYKDFLAGQITEEDITAKLEEILGFTISLSQCHDAQVKRLVAATGMPTDCIFQMTAFENEYFLIFGKLKARNRNRQIWLTSDRRKCTLWDSYYLAKLAVIERIRIEYQHYIHSIESKDNDLVYLSILNEIANGFHVCGRVCPVYAYEKEQVLYPEVMKFLDKLKIPVKLRIPGQSTSGILFRFSLLQQVLPVLKQYSISKVDFLYYATIPDGYLIIIKALMEQHKMQEADERYHRNNTPKHQDYMKENSFLTVYRYIEVDEDCDLDKMQELEKEFLALGDILGKHPYDASIRFRKLGRHHASGLYSPAYQCVCIDVRSPNSYVHEFLHMYDHFHGMLSEGYDFKEIRLQYEACLQEYLSDCEDPDLKARLNGNSKYNLDYYFVPTEVFARCGELYFTRFRGVDNSLLRFERGFDYPENEKLLELIKKYYDQHFLTEEISS